MGGIVLEDKKDQQNGSNQVTESGIGSDISKSQRNRELKLALRNKELRLECRPWWPLYYKARKARIEAERADAAFWASISPEAAERAKRNREDAAVWAAYRGATLEKVVSTDNFEAGESQAKAKAACA